MKTAIDGKIGIKLFWGCTYSCGGMTPIKTLYKIGRLRIVKVVYARYDPFDIRYYKEDVLNELRQHYNVVREPIPGGEQDWYVVESKIDGGYVGTPEDAYRYLQSGIYNVQRAEPKNKVCSIGFNPQEQKWYGWSHRAMYGFGVGSKVEKGDCCASSGWTEEYLAEHPEEDKSLPVGFVAKTLKDAKRMAMAFAESVS